jgi:hypothetical protein
MATPTDDQSLPPIQALDVETGRQWLRLSGELAAAAAGPSPSWVNEKLDAAARSQPQSPLAPAYRLWMGDNLAREGRYPEAIAAFDAAIDPAQAAARLLPAADPTRGALLHKAQAATLAGDAQLAISTYEELAKTSSDAASALFQAGLIAETNARDGDAARFYRTAASEYPSRRTGDPAQLARRALERLEHAQATYLPSAPALGVSLAASLGRRDISQLDRLASTTHFAIAPAGGHMAFEDPEMLEELYRDLLESSVSVRPKLFGSGGKRYLLTSGWTGDWFREEVAFALTRAPKGWQWTGVVLIRPHEAWIERWRPASRQTNQPLPFTLRAPWPSGRSFKAGGLTEFIAQQAAVAAAGIFGPALAAAFARNACGFGPRGFYYNQGSTHDEEDAFAIDFTRYERNVPYDNESGGTPVLAARDGIVIRVSAGTQSGDDSASNTVEIVHADPADPTNTDRFRSRYLHLAGPFMIPVSELMLVITGQRLGLMDDTGNSVWDHLHFSVHDRDIPHPNVSYGSSVRPSPLSGARLGDGDSGKCVKSDNVERFPGLNFTPPLVNFGSVPVGEVRSRTVTVRNTAGTSIDMSLPAPPGGVFQWEAIDLVLPNGDETSFDVAFRPTTNAIERGTLTVTSTAPGSPHAIGLVGKGPGGFPEPEPEPEPQPPPTLEVTPGTLNFGSVPLGTTRTLAFTIENVTGGDVEVAFAAPSSGSTFQWAAFSGVLTNGEERTFQASFRPTSNAIQQATLTVTSSAPGSPHSIGLIGKGPGGF